MPSAAATTTQRILPVHRPPGEQGLSEARVSEVSAFISFIDYGIDIDTVRYFELTCIFYRYIGIISYCTVSSYRYRTFPIKTLTRRRGAGGGATYDTSKPVYSQFDFLSHAFVL